MIPFEAHEVIGRERREALVAEAEAHRRSRPARLRARRALVGRMSSLALSIRRPGVLFQRRSAECDVEVIRPAQRPA
jgi:hypothetical protein